jgi:uroporphyrin-III C-methyltransferase / precorrin-2 dehydrogenase / sirohydrochlorin ferrochelatase
MTAMSELLPLFVNLQGRRVVLVGGGPVAAGKLTQLLAARAEVFVVAPDVHSDIGAAGVVVARRAFVASDLDNAWLVVAAATPDVNREVAEAAAARRVFVNAVDDPANASAFLSGVVRREGVTVAISTNGEAPGLAGLLREALDSLLPRELGAWLREARRQRRFWKRDAVPMSERRPLLLDALNRLYARRRSADEPMSRGHVSLVGAGPGDPGLLTRKAVARLRSADLVLYDALVDTRVLRLARHAQRFFVGKRAGRHALSQTEIHTVMIRAARRGRRVVRLKGGDPFVLGRGGEEALALKEAGVAFDVVPGVTSAVAAAALGGIPVTHRGVASAFLTVSGHDEQSFDASVDGVPPAGVTLVVLMGLGRHAALARILIDRGWPRGTASAIVAGASRPDQTVWRGSLGELARGVETPHGEAPAVIVVGAVAALDVRAASAEVSATPVADSKMASRG